MSDVSTWEGLAALHTRLRWLGAALFLVAAVLLVVRVVLVAQGALPPIRGILPSIAGLGFSLGSFGTANDTALWAMSKLDASGALPPAYTTELAHERSVRAERLAGVHAAPKVALGMPVAAVLLLAWLAWSAAGAAAGA